MGISTREECRLFLQRDITIRDFAALMGYSKSTAHRHLTIIAERDEPSLAKDVREVLDRHKREALIRANLTLQRKREKERYEQKQIRETETRSSDGEESRAS